MLRKKFVRIIRALRKERGYFYLFLVLFSLIPAVIVAITNINRQLKTDVNLPVEEKLARANVCGNCPVDGTNCAPGPGSPTCVALSSCNDSEPTYNVHVCVDGKYMSYFQAGGAPPAQKSCFPDNPCGILGVTIINNNSSTITNNVQSSAESGSSSNNATTNVSVSNSGNINTVNINSSSSNVSQSNSNSSNKATPTPTSRPTATPTPRPTNTPTPKPTATHTPTPTKAPPTPTPTSTPLNFNIFSWFTPPTPTPTAAIIYVYPPTATPTTYNPSLIESKISYTPPTPTPQPAYTNTIKISPTVPVYPTSRVEQTVPVISYPSNTSYQPPVQVLQTYTPSTTSPLILTTRDNDIITQAPPSPSVAQTIKPLQSSRISLSPVIQKPSFAILNIANFSLVSGALGIQVRADYGSSVDLQLQPLTGTADSLLLSRKNLGFETNIAEFNWDSTITPNGVYNLFAFVNIAKQPSVIVGPVQIKVENAQITILTANDIVSPSTFIAANVPVDKTTVIDKIENTTSEVNKGLAITMSGKSKPNAIVTLLIYSNPIVATVKTDENGVWSYTLEKPLPVGKHDTYVVLKDNQSEVRSEVKEFFIAPVFAGGAQKESLVLESTNDYQQIINFLVVSGFVLLSAVGCFVLVLIFIKTFKFISINV